MIGHEIFGNVDEDDGWFDAPLTDEERMVIAQADTEQVSRQLVDALREIRYLKTALEEIAGNESGQGLHRPCCARGQRIALAALKGGPKQFPSTK